MKVLNPQKVFAQYRDGLKPYEPVIGRKYTIIHSDVTGELFVIIGNTYADDLITSLRDEVKISWEINESRLMLIGSVTLDGDGIKGDAEIRSKIFYNEMPIALQALRQADRFLFEKHYSLDKAPVYIQFISNNPKLHKMYYYGSIGDYQIKE